MRKVFLVLGIISLSLLAVSTCWSGGQQSGQVAVEEPAEPSEINVLLMASAAGTGLNDMLADFESKNPLIKVKELTYAPAADYDTKVELELAAGGGAYDVIWATGRSYIRWALNDWIVEVEPIIKDPKWTDAASFDFEDFIGGAIRFLNVEGKLYGLPILNTSQVLFYRGDIFEKFGISKPPDTWDELMQVAKKIHTPEVGAVGMRGSRVRGGVMWPFPQVLYGFGGRIVKDYPTDMHPVFDSPEAIKAAEYYAELLQKYGYKGTLSAQYKDVSLAMQQGKMAILIDGYPGVGPYEDPEKSTVAGKLRFHYVPGGPAGRWPAFGAHALAITAGSQNKQAGWEFIKWTLSTERQLRGGLEKNEMGLTRKSVLTHPEYLKKFNYADGELMKVLSVQLDQYVRAFYRPISAEWGEVEDATALAMSKVLAGEQDAASALKEANKELYEIYKEAGYYKE
jgi:multiple sugar transport system substrate-binding protein